MLTRCKNCKCENRVLREIATQGGYFILGHSFCNQTQANKG